MNPHWLLIDAPFLCHRAFHTTGDMENGVVYGFLRTVAALRRDFDSFDHPVRFLFAFEGDGKSKREQLLPSYKQSRRDRYAAEPLDMRRKRDDMRRQVNLLRHAVLPPIGFANVHWQDGYEADDIIADVCTMFGALDIANATATIVSADKDLYQCLRPGVNMYNPVSRSAVGFADLRATGITGRWWAGVKAIAGCRSDDIPGVYRVSEKTAINYLTGKLKADSQAYRRIATERHAVVERNRPLVTLPMEGVRPVELRDDFVTPGAWNGVVESLKMPTLKGEWT